MHLPEIPRFNREKHGKGNGRDTGKPGLPGALSGASAAALPGGAPPGLGAGPTRQGPGLTPPPGLGPGGPGPAKSKNMPG